MHSSLELEAVLEAVAYPVAVFDRHGAVVVSNPAFRILYETERAVLEEEVQRALQGGSIEKREINLSSGRCLLLNAAPVQKKRPRNAYAVITLRDITGQRRYEAEIEQHQTQLDATNAELRRSNEELQQFAFVVAHDLQEPLATMLGFCDRLMTRYSDALGAEARNYLQLIADSSKQMREKVSALLAYARVRGAPAVESVCEAEAALRWASTQVEPHLRDAGGAIEADPLPPVVAEFERLTQVFQNLLTNAVLYRGSEPPRIRITAEPEGDHWRFCVSDNGVGIGPEYHERVFGIFKRLHGREIPGAGVGLALCRRIVELQGGRIWVESEPGRGARFYFTMPAARARAAAASQP